MKVMNYHERMKNRNRPKLAVGPGRANTGYAMTSKAGRYSSMIASEATEIWDKAATGSKVLTFGLARQSEREKSDSFQLVVTGTRKVSGKVLRVSMKKGSMKGRFIHKTQARSGLFYGASAKSLLILRTFSNRKSSRNALVALASGLRTRQDEPASQHVSDVHDLAVKTAQLLGANSVTGAVEYLTTVFRSVSAGDIPTPESDVEVVPAASGHTDAADPLAAARARGRRFALEEYESPDNLALLDARDYAGRNERTINEQRQNGELYALLPPGKARGFRYPKWQFDAEPERLKPVLRKFADAGANAWVIHSFMRRKRDELSGRAPAEVILDDTTSVAPVIDLAMRDLVGEQGAS